MAILERWKAATIGAIIGGILVPAIIFRLYMTLNRPLSPGTYLARWGSLQRLRYAFEPGLLLFGTGHGNGYSMRAIVLGAVANGVLWAGLFAGLSWANARVRPLFWIAMALFLVWVYRTVILGEGVPQTLYLPV